MKIVEVWLWLGLLKLPITRCQCWKFEIHGNYTYIGKRVLYVTCLRISRSCSTWSGVMRFELFRGVFGEEAGFAIALVGAITSVVEGNIEARYPIWWRNGPP